MRIVKEAEERKNEILDVAEELFGTYGFCANLSLVEMVRKSKYHLLQLLMLPLSYCLFRYWAKKNGFKRIKNDPKK